MDPVSCLTSNRELRWRKQLATYHHFVILIWLNYCDCRTLTLTSTARSLFSHHQWLVRYVCLPPTIIGFLTLRGEHMRVSLITLTDVEPNVEQRCRGEIPRKTNIFGDGKTGRENVQQEHMCTSYGISVKFHWWLFSSKILETLSLTFLVMYTNFEGAILILYLVESFLMLLYGSVSSHCHWVLIYQWI